MKIQKINFKNIGVGVASKDGSSVSVFDSVITDYKLYAAMSYIKKDFYKKMTDLRINNSFISGEDSFKRQKGTNMSVDDIDILESNLNIQKLYKTDQMVK